jgi:hypothetical protein
MQNFPCPVAAPHLPTLPILPTSCSKTSLHQSHLPQNAIEAEIHLIAARC